MQKFRHLQIFLTPIKYIEFPYNSRFSRDLLRFPEFSRFSRLGDTLDFELHAFRFKCFGRSKLCQRGFDLENLSPPSERLASFGICGASFKALRLFITPNGLVGYALALVFQFLCRLKPSSLLESNFRDYFFSPFIGNQGASVADKSPARPENISSRAVREAAISAHWGPHLGPPLQIHWIMRNVIVVCYVSFNLVSC